jgi:hypothetical protein
LGAFAKGRSRAPLTATSPLVRLAALCLGLSCLAAVPASAHASWTDPLPRGAVTPGEIEGTPARGPIRDLVRERRLVRKSSHAPSRVERFADPHGHAIVIGTSIPDLDLRPFAEVLAGTIHGDEIEALRTKVVLPHEVGPECDGGDLVVACYGADDPDRLSSGEMIIPSSSPDLIHAMVHEYGHHMDNQLLNLGHLGLCDFASDGSRRWFFARDAHDDLFGRSGCNNRVTYGRLLGELYAEDFVALNGIDEWFTSDFPPPTGAMLGALNADIARPFRPLTRLYRGRVRARRYRPRYFRLTTHTFFQAVLRGPRSRRADLDLYLYRRGSRRPLERSTRRRSRESVDRILPPGRYEVGVHAYGRGGGYRLRLNLD